MKRLTLEVEGGRNISLVCTEAQVLADRTDYEVAFVFNGVTCVAQPGGCEQLLAERQQSEQAWKPVVYSGADNGTAA